jgi:hypothetical protein
VSNLRRLRRSVTQTDPAHDDRPGAAAVERAGNYPGPGRHNAYRCDDCGALTVVVHRDTGVTPMFLGCRATEGCQGRGVSLGYRSGPIPPHLLPARWEWYRPERGDKVLRDPAMRLHVEQGGLALRTVGESPQSDPSDRGTVTTATTLTALLITGLVALGVYAHHLADQDCHQRATTVEAHAECERAAS